MEQAYGFTPTHTEQHISPNAHSCKKDKFKLKLALWMKDLQS